MSKTPPKPKKTSKPRAAKPRGGTPRAAAPRARATAKPAKPAKPSRATPKRPSKKAPAKKARRSPIVKKPSLPAAAAKRAPKKSAEPSARKIAQAAAREDRARSAENKKLFRPRSHVIYPGHGVGRIKAIESLEVGDIVAQVFVLEFPNTMIVRVPVSNASAVGMRTLAGRKTMRAAMRTLRGRARIKRTMWSRRAQEYEAKINSGNLVAIAEVVRDLYRDIAQPEQSYSERQLYEQALERMAQEVALLRKESEEATSNYLETILTRATGGTAPARRRNHDEDPAAEAAE